jgi:limonene-1,2-epoxide hydrolase
MTKTATNGTGTLLTPTQVVEAFLAGVDDLDAAFEHVADDLVYENIGTFPLPTFRSKASAKKFLQYGFKLCTAFRIEVHTIAANGPYVMTERTDMFVFGETEARFWVCGTFEVREGKIVAWRDYFDSGNFFLGLGVGATKAAFRKLTRLVG